MPTEPPKDSSMYGEGKQAAALPKPERGPLYLTDEEARQHTMAGALVSRVVELCNQQLDEEEKKITPDTEKLKYWHELGLKAHQDRSMLSPKNHAEVARVLHTYEEALRRHGKSGR